MKTFMLLIVLTDAHGNMIQQQVRNFPSIAACELVGEALRPAIVWHCEPGPPPLCPTPAIS